MNLIEAIDPLYSISGFSVGVLVGMTGVGGGSLMTPLLILLFGVHPATAVGTDLLFAATTKVGGSLVHGIRGSIDWTIVRRLATGSVPAAAATLVVLSYVGLKSTAGRELITIVLGIALFLTALALIFRNFIVEFYATHIGELDGRRTALLTVLVGSILGVLVSISSVGAGAIGVTALVLLYPRLGIAKLVGSDIAHAVPLTLIAGIGHWILGSIDGHIYLSLIVGSLPGIVLGAYVATRIHETALRLILAATLLFVGGKLLMTPQLEHTASTEAAGMQGR
jgi:uncharacterized protein